jgi:hypothetical protein
MWIHDGIWLYPHPPIVLMQQAEHHAQETTGMKLHFKRNLLHEHHLQALTQLSAFPSVLARDPIHIQKLRALNHLDWWDGVHRGPIQLPREVRTQLRHVAHPLPIDNPATLHRFFVRTARNMH